MVLSSATEELNLENIGVIRNCWLTSSTKGMIEDIRRVNKWSVNMKELRRGASQKNSSINSLYNARQYDNGLIVSAPFVQMNKIGSTLSTYRDAQLRIPLSDLFFMGELQALDTSTLGEIRIHLEFEDFGYLSLREAKMFRSPPLASENELQNTVSATNSLTTKWNWKLQSVEQSPYFVGQWLNIHYTEGSTDKTQDAQITQIAFVPPSVSASSGYMVLTFNFQFPVATNITAVEISNPDENVHVSFESADLVMCQIMGGASVPKQKDINYMTLETEEYTVHSNNLSKIFELPSNCVNAFLMFDNNDSNLISSNPKVKSYRMRLNNVDVYPYDIKTNTGSAPDFPGVVFQDNLHLDALNRTMLNSGYALRNTSLCAMARDMESPVNDLSMIERFANPKLQILVCATPAPLTVNPKLLQYTIKTVDTEPTNIETVIIYKMVLKTLML
jgi:hypothetical protein